MTAPHFLLLLVAVITINPQTKISRIPLPYLGDVMIPFVQSHILIVANAWVFPFRRNIKGE
jgi:hypothetical protein